VHLSQRMTESLRDADDRVYVVPSFSEFGAPRWPAGRGATISGLRMDSTSEDFLRAGVEAMAFHAYDIFAAITTPHVDETDHVSVDGGGAANDYLCQLTADLIGKTVVRPSTQEQTSVGAAKAALTGLGKRPAKGFGQDYHGATRFEPRADRNYGRSGYAHWSTLVDRALESYSRSDR
jgi:glycerol kinase